MTVKEQALNLIHDSLLKSRRESDMDWTEIKDKYPIMEHSSDILRRYSTGWKLLEEWGIVDFSNIKPTDDIIPAYRETTELTANGQQKSDKLIEMSEENKKDEKYILSAHGYDENEWSIVNAKHSVYNVNAKGGITKTLYSSKITVKPKASGINIEKFLEKIEKGISPINVKVNSIESERMLEIPLTDLHMGINTKSEYQPFINEIIELIKSKHWDSIYIPLGSDLLHHDTFDGKTSNQTQIEVVDIQKAWTEAFQIYEELISVSLENSNTVTCHYVCGNHDKVMSYGLARALEVRFPQADWDNDIYNKKLFTWKDVAILFTHGDKANRINKTAIKEYGKLIADKAVFEIHSGHLHFSQSKDEFGLVTRTLPTRAKSDLWHSENNFLGAIKHFQVFEYQSDMLKTIHNI